MENEESFCPSFSSYACERIAETAERVRLEFSDELNDEFEFINPSSSSDFFFPIFDSAVKPKTKLRDLFLRDREDSNSSSSSSDDEEDRITSEVYRQSPNRGWKKSKSTGSTSMPSRRWRIRDLLKRSYSEGKQSLSFLNSNSTNREESSSSSSSKKKKNVSAHEKFYLRNKAIKEENKRKSYLPYKQDLLRFFFNVQR